MRKPLITGAALLLLAATVATAGCTSRTEASSAAPVPAGQSAAPSSAAAPASFTVAFVPKLQGIPYFEAMNTGGKKAEADIPGLKWVYQGSTTADPAAQANIVRSLIQQKVDAIFVAPNDPNSMAPVLKEAADAGIKVGTTDTDAPDSVRSVFVQQATDEGIGKYTADTLAKAMGEKGTVGIVSCGETAQNLNSWIAVEKTTFKNYPNIKVLDPVYAGEDMAKATKMATDLINAHQDLTGLIGQCSTSAPAVAEAVKTAGKIGKVFSVGVGTPKAMLPYLTDGSSSGSILWNVEDLGYLTAWAGAQLVAGKSFQPTQDVASIKGVTFDGTSKALLLGPPTVFTKDNAGQFDY